MIENALFLGREENIKTISKFFNSDKDNAALIYGRCRVGKTELIKHCLFGRFVLSVKKIHLPIFIYIKMEHAMVPSMKKYGD